MQAAFNRTFSSFEVPNFRLFFIGQGISASGTWAQTIGLAWLVLQLTHSGAQLGLVVAAQYLPMLVLGTWGGLIADRFSKRHILYLTQTIAALLALTLGTLVVTHSIRIWMVYLFAAGLGLAQVVDKPSRQTFVMEMVGPERIKNAVTLNSIMINGARIIGPSIAAILIATVGIGLCFIINATSYLAVLGALLLMRQDQLRPVPKTERQSGQIRAGLRYVWDTPHLRATLIMMVIIGTFAYEFPVILPLFATKTLHGNAGTYSALTAAMGLGAVIGGLFAAGRQKVAEREIMLVAALFGMSILLLSAMPNLFGALIVQVFVGVLSILFISLGNTTLQLSSDPSMRGRVMSMWSIAFIGTTPIGGPIIGYIGDHASPRIGLMVGGLSAIIGAGVGWLADKKGE